ncbi:MAG: S9 family peptidase [Ignavibacteriaceae bacterium]
MNRTIISVVIMLLTAASVFSQKKPFNIESLYKVKSVSSPHLSPAGKQICFQSTEYNLYKGESNSDIYLVSDDGTGLENLTNSKESESNPFWNIDGKKIYFQKKSQIYSISIPDKKIEEVMEYPTGITRPVLSPDGNLIVFTTEIYPECGTNKECNKSILDSSENGPVQAYIADSLLFRHWTEYLGQKETHIFIYNLKDKKYTDIVHSELASPMYKLGGDIRYNFSPDSKEICFTNNPEKNQANSTNSDLYIESVKGGKPDDITAKNKAWDGNPIYSPDGKFIAYKMQEQPGHESDRYRIAVYNRDTKQINIVTEDFDNMVSEFVWSEDSGSIYFTAADSGYTPIYKVDIGTKEINEVMPGRSVFSLSISKDNLFYLATSVGNPREIYSYNLNEKAEKQVTDFNKELLNQVDFRSAEQIWVPGADGINVQVFIVKPHNFDPDKKYPLILNVHGGPQGQWMDSFRGDWQVYPGAGYIVAFPNPHGSTGRGQAYTNEISGDYGGKVYQDLMKVTDALEKLPYVDTSKVGAMGWSFGGYMMDWFQAQTKRFKCLASMMGIFDLESMWGSTEEQWFVNWDLKGQPWNSEDFKKYSPSNYVKNFATPTLILTGQKDYRVPYTQSLQYFTTLQTLGIDSRLIIFKNDGHWPDFVKSMPLYYNAHLEWFHKYLGGAPAPYNSKDMVKNTAFENKE